LNLYKAIVIIIHPIMIALDILFSCKQHFRNMQIEYQVENNHPKYKTTFILSLYKIRFYIHKNLLYYCL
jgi:hypothetical protein